MRSWLRCLALALLAGVEPTAAGEVSPRQIRRQIDAAEKLLAEGRSDDAVASLAAAVKGIGTLRAMPGTAAAARLLSERAGKARAGLTKAGVDVSGLVVPPPAAAPAPPPRRPAAAGVKPGISFAKQVAPFLVANCGRCHVFGRKGGFQMASYGQLMQSAKVSPGMGSTSELVEVILSGEMPPGGGISADDIGMLVAWIDAGAACDAAPAADLSNVVQAASAPPPVMPPPPRPVLGPGDVSFAADVVPVLLAQCVNCHGDREPEANLRMTSLEALVKGGRTGAALVPGKSADSLLVKKLRGVGIEGQRMPLGKPPLPEPQIETIAKWIDQGARIDLLTPRDPLETVAAAGRSERLSAAELEKVRFTAGERLWNRVLPDEPPVVESVDGVRLLGNLPPGRMDELAVAAADLTGPLSRVLGADGQLAKGGVVVYAFRNGYDYSEFWQVVLGEERPKGLFGHAGVVGDVAYAALLVPTSDEAGEETRLLLAEQLAAAALAARGLPAWFCGGAGRAAAVQAVPGAALAQVWKRDASGAVGRLGSAADFFAGRVDPAISVAAAGGFMTSLSGGGKIAQCMELCEAGTPFEQAFAKIFRGPPDEVFAVWAARNAGR